MKARIINFLSTKRWFLNAVRKSINIYTEEEVRAMFAGVQYEIAQKIIGNRSESIVPLYYFQQNKKSNFYKTLTDEDKRNVLRPTIKN